MPSNFNILLLDKLKNNNKIYKKIFSIWIKLHQMKFSNKVEFRTMMKKKSQNTLIKKHPLTNK